MLTRYLTFALVSSVLCGSSLVFAAACKPNGTDNFECTMTLENSSGPVPTVNPHVSLDILGIKPGMSLTEVKRIMVAHYKSEPSENSSGQYGQSGEGASGYLVYKNVSMHTRPWVYELVNANNSYGFDQTTVLFATPATGQTVVTIRRIVQFRTPGPTVKQLLAALDKKYGPESIPGRRDKAGFITLNWVYGKDGKLEACKENFCQCPGSANLGYIQTTLDTIPTGANYDKSLANDEYECVSAQVNFSFNDPVHATELDVVVNDPAEKVHTTKELYEQMHAAAVAEYKSEKPSKAPTL